MNADPEQTKDFNLHHILVRVTLVDSVTNLPVRDARLIFMSSAGVNVPSTDDSGRVDITTLGPGPVELTGQAPGYQTRRLHFEVVETDDPQDVTLALTQKGPGRKFVAMLSSGTPASVVSARYVDQSDRTGGFLIPCDSAGNCTAPDGASGQCHGGLLRQGFRSDGSVSRGCRRLREAVVLEPDGRSSRRGRCGETRADSNARTRWSW